MKKIKILTARETLAQIEKGYFKGANLMAASRFEGEKRRSFMLSQVERLLTEKQGGVSMAIWLSDTFWTADEGRVLPKTPTPLLSLKEQQTLTDEEMSRLRLILEVAGLCHDLALHFTFDLKEAFGIRKDDFWVSNKQLVEWLTTTEYEQIAMHTAYTMRKHAISVYAYNHYLPAQDELAELYSSEYNCIIGNPDMTEMPSHEYVKMIINTLLRIERHWQRGRRLGLSPDLVTLHDEIYGVMPLRFDKGVLLAAQALYDYMDKEVKGRLVFEECNLNSSSWSERPESVRRTWDEVLHRFAEKVREVRTRYLSEGWLRDGSLSFNYLIAHAERCGQGLWNEEDGL